MSVWSKFTGLFKKSAPKTFVRYASATPTRFSEGFATAPVNQHALIRRGVTSMRARSREMYRDNTHFKRFIKLLDINVVGHKGIQFQSQVVNKSGKKDLGAIAAIEKHHTIFSRQVDLMGELSMRQAISQVMRHTVIDGEVFVRFHYGSEFKYWIAIELLEADSCPIDLNDVSAAGVRIVTGIELDGTGRKVAYYFRTDKRGTETHVFGAKNYVRVPAEDVLHVYEKEFSAQLRGVPWGQVVMESAHQIKGYVQAVIIAQRVAASQMGWFESKNGDDDNEFNGDGPEKDENGEDTGDFVMDAEPGVFRTVPKNKKLVSWTPNITAQDYSSMSKAMLRGFAAGLNGPGYNSLAMDYSDVNYNSLRMAAVDERDSYKVIQEFLVESFCQPLVDRWLRVAHLAQLITVNGAPLSKTFDAYDMYEFQPRRWLGVDPAKDAAANKDNITLRLRSRSSIIREDGGDPETVFKEIAHEEAYIKSLNIELSLPTNVQTSDKQAKSGSQDASGAGDASGQPADGGGSKP